MSRYIDVNIIVDDILQNGKEIEKLVALAKLLGYDIIAFATFNPHNIKSIREKAVSLSRTYDIDVIVRLSLYTHEIQALKKMLRRYRRYVELIGVYCVSDKITNFAAKDHRVDMITLALGPKIRVKFDDAKANLLLQGETALEFVFWDSLRSISSQTYLPLRLWTYVAKSYEIPIIISSGARCSLELRDPKVLEAFLKIILGIADIASHDFLLSRIATNREKMEGKIPIPGVKVFGKGDYIAFHKEAISSIQNYKPKWPIDR